MMKNSYLLIGIIGLLFWGCEKGNLDSLAFPNQKLDAYKFEAQDAVSEAVPAEYDVLAANRTLVSMISTDKETGEKFTIYGVYIGDITQINADTIILYCHGQSLHMDAYWPRATLLASIIEKHNYGVFMMDYRGYGMSEGKTTERALYEDVDASIDWLKSNGATPNRTFYYGYSLGCIPVIDRAAYRTDFVPSKIILESPLASVANLAQSSLFLTVDPSFVSTLEFNNVEKIKDVNVPLLWIHGVEDDYIEIENGELIYENYQGVYKDAARIDGAGHGDIPKVMGYANYLEKLRSYIRL
jgi:pimeloyl-ACP methyl ester carboxylesterase